MKKIIVTLVVVLSFTYMFGANQAAVNPQKTLDTKIEIMPFIVEEEADEVFDFDYKSYLPKDFKAYDLSDNETDANNWVDSVEEDEAFNFDHKQYLPVGFNPNATFNSLFLAELKWIDEEEDAPFDFDTKKYFNKTKKKE